MNRLAALGFVVVLVVGTQKVGAGGSGCICCSHLCWSPYPPKRKYYGNRHNGEGWTRQNCGILLLCPLLTGTQLFRGGPIRAVSTRLLNVRRYANG